MATLLSLIVIVVLLFAPFYIIYKPPALLIRYFAYRWPDVLWEVSLPKGFKEKVVALTIDDAPSSHTSDILRALEEEGDGAHATFFVIGGQVSGREEVLRDIVRAGHELGNHAMHDEPARSLPEVELEAQILAVQRMIEEAYTADGKEEGPAGRYFRPGSGFFTDKMRVLVANMGYRLVLGGIYPHDAQLNYPWLNARHILSLVRPGGIIICHDRRSWTLPMLKRVLPELRRRGYRIVTVTELLKLSKES
jgi:peptidoglycan/xylan/chitin deacetylase (PgdA/CDA1 family)